MMRAGYFFCVLLFLFSCSSQRKTDWSVGLQREGRNPYDLYLAYHALAQYYPGSTISLLSSSKTSITNALQHQGESAMMLLIGKSIRFSARERSALLSFVERGNELVLFSGSIDAALLEMWGMRAYGARESEALSVMNPPEANQQALSLSQIPDRSFGIWGRNLRGYFLWESGTHPEISVLGKVHNSGSELPNVCRISRGAGHITLVATPLVLSNYFLLQAENRIYMQTLLQQIGTHFDTIYWGSYRDRNPDISGWQLFLRHPALRSAVFLFIFLLLVYLIGESRRKQRRIPEMSAPDNSYASFVETVGMLYYSHHDNANLCHKLEQHFLEWVRLRYRLSTEVLDEEFIQQLSGKSGVGLLHVRLLVDQIHELRVRSSLISDRFLFDFYTAMRVFYTINIQDGNRF